ncbi:ribonuclease III [Alteromonas phage vB_AcoS-R7M]|uniref:Ribonuclease III n=1 Tax=Alteromonas phage vB_AcoS-R7M TaxID=2729541 RepID=A0A6M3YN73_9CAUD|nr:ribonuclease III [Alteromonas phage vB_AcoS-R7M]QJI53363.1 ribonuclease III [Alteromonas phage vB_AcoS-R7M]
MTTVRLELPELADSQAGKYLTHNEALKKLDLFVNGSLISRTVQTPPGSPYDGMAYYVPTGATGDWSSNVGSLAHRYNGQWDFYPVPVDQKFFINDEGVNTRWNGSSFSDEESGGGGGGGAQGKAYVDVTSGNQTLNATQASVPVIQIDGTPGTSRTITLPALEQMWVVANDSNAGCTLQTGSGGTIFLEAGYQYVIFGDGTGIRAAVTIAPQGLKMNGDLILPIYTTASAPDPTTRYMVCIGVTDGDGGDPCLAVSDGGAWKRVALGATISAS